MRLVLADGLTVPLAVHVSDGSIVVSLPRSQVGADAARWAGRLGIEFSDRVPERGRPATTIVETPTVVLATDSVVAEVAAVYAGAVGAHSQFLAGGERLPAAIAAVPDGRSATLVTLAADLDQGLVDAVAAGNARRVAAGRAPVTTGVLTGLDLPRLTWLIAKTILCLARLPTPDEWVSCFDGARGSSATRSFGGGALRAAPSAPWLDPRTLAQGVIAHGVAFDLALGDTVLCSQPPPTSPQPTPRVAPSCYDDGVCFRLGREEGPRMRRHAQEATPLFWGIESCGAIPFRDNAFGQEASYALALLEGAAVSVVGSYLALTSSGLAARAFGALLEAGWSTGEIAAALGGAEPAAADFNPYLCLGSPDLRVATPADPVDPAQPIEVRANDTDTVAIDLATDGPMLAEVIDDDGDDAWRAARAARLEAPGRAALVVAFDRARTLAGELTLADASAAREALAQRCESLDRQLGTLAELSFAATQNSTIAELRDQLREGAAAVHATQAVRSISAGAGILRAALARLGPLEESIAAEFVRLVLAQDINFDRESENGFVAGKLRRDGDSCPLCGSPLFVALDRWASDPREVYRRATCANCFGVALRPQRSPLTQVTLSTEVVEGMLRINATLASQVERQIDVRLAAAPRRGESIPCPAKTVRVEPGETAATHFTFPASTRAVVTYRLLVLCEAAAELYTVFDPIAARTPSTSASAATVAGAEPAGPDQGTPAGLNQIG